VGTREATGRGAGRWIGPTLVVLAVTLVLYGNPVPRLSEELYLPIVKRVYDSSYLWGDWTFSGTFGEHWLFDQVFAPLAGAVSVSTFGWIGRLVLWPVLALLLLRVGNRFGLGPWPAALALVLWILNNQSLIGGEWIIGTFEAKTVAYACLLGAILAVTRERVPAGLALLGLTFSFHPAVGLWSGWGLGIALLALPETRWRAVRWSWLALLLAVPGIVGALSATGDVPESIQRFVVLQAIPYHLDPFFGGKTLGPLQASLHTAVVLGMFAFNIWAERRSDHDLTQRLFLWFQYAAAVPFALAYVARSLHVWEYLRLMPLRSFPLIVPLVFFFQAVRLALAALQAEGAPRRRRRRSRRAGMLGLAALVAVALLPTAPLLAAPRFVVRNVAAWTKEDDVARAFDWVRRNTPDTTTCIVPLDRQDAFARTERPQVVNWQAIRYDELEEWKRRVDQLVGGRRYFAGDSWHGDLADIRARYDGLTFEQIQRIAARYDATCVVTESRYPLQVLHRAGNARVYAVPRSNPSGSAEPVP
jgi:hypothetical protein